MNLFINMKGFAAMLNNICNNKHESNVWKGLAAGVIAGLAGGFVMNQFQWLWSKLTSDEKDSEHAHSPKQSGHKSDMQQERESSGETDAPATVKLASAISENVFDHKLREDEKEPAGTAIHYGFSLVTGGIYGVTTELEPEAAVGAGAPFGAAVWLLADEITVPLAGLSKGPTAYPLSKHAYSLASHLVYGVATEATRRAVRNML
jgi:putative membrane protein